MKIPWKTLRKYIKTYFQLCQHCQVFSVNQVILIDNLWFWRMLKFPRRPEIKFHHCYKPNSILSCQIIYRCGENKLIWDGHSKHRTPIACNPCPIPLKYQKFINEEIQLIDTLGCISKCLNPWAAPVLGVPKSQMLLHPNKHQLCLVLAYRLLNKSSNTAHNQNKIILHYTLPIITDLLPRFCNSKILSLDLRSWYHHIGLIPEATPKTAFATTSGKWHRKCSPI